MHYKHHHNTLEQKQHEGFCAAVLLLDFLLDHPEYAQYQRILLIVVRAYNPLHKHMLHIYDAPFLLDRREDYS